MALKTWIRAGSLLLALAVLAFLPAAGAEAAPHFRIAEARSVSPAPATSGAQGALPITAGAARGGLLFSGRKISDFVANESAPGAVTEVPGPAGESEPVLKMTVADSDVYPRTPTDNPRAQLLSPAIFKPGDEFWWHSKFFLPASFPSSIPGWLTVLEGPYGAPYAGSPPWHIEINGEGIRWQRNSTYDWDIPWEMPLVKNQWVEVLLHARFGSDGWVEMWVDGEPITFFQHSLSNPDRVPPTRRLAMQTMDSSNNGGPNFAVIQSYREAGMFSSVSLLQGPMLIGTSRSAVEN